MNKWKALAQAFYNVGACLEEECCYHAASDPAFDQLYIQYVQLLETIKVQRIIINNRFDEVKDS